VAERKCKVKMKVKILTVGEKVVDELSSLNSITKLSRSDLMNNRLFIIIVFVVEIKFFVNFADSTKANTGLGMSLMMGIALGKERNNRGVFSSRSRPHSSCKKSRS
jgi:hypothetical protein